MNQKSFTGVIYKWVYFGQKVELRFWELTGCCVIKNTKFGKFKSITN